MKPMFANHVTTPPKESGFYWTDIGELNFSQGRGWRKPFSKDACLPEYWYSESMPPELAKAVERLPLAVEYLNRHEYAQTAEAIQTILKYL